MFNIFPFKKGKKEIQKKTKARQASRKAVREPLNIEWRMPGIIMAVASVLITTLIMVSPEKEILPIEKIRIAGYFTHLDSSAIENQLKPYLGRGFFSVDILEIQKELQQQAWISSVSVRRLWPNQIRVSIVEKQAVARWDDGHLLSRDAKIFAADSQAFQHLPVINGYTGQSVELLSRFASLQKQFTRHGLQIIGMSEDSKGSLALKLNNGLAISLGSDNNDHKIDTFLAVYSHQIKPRLEHIRHIDFRYNNGFAIAWKKDHLNKIGKSGSRGNRNV